MAAAASGKEVVFKIFYSGSPLFFDNGVQWRGLRIHIRTSDELFPIFADIPSDQSAASDPYINHLPFKIFSTDTEWMTFNPAVAKTMKLFLEISPQDSPKSDFLKIEIPNSPDFEENAGYHILVENTDGILQATFIKADANMAQLLRQEYEGGGLSAI